MSASTRLTWAARASASSVRPRRTRISTRSLREGSTASRRPRPRNGSRRRPGGRRWRRRAGPGRVRAGRQRDRSWRADAGRRSSVPGAADGSPRSVRSSVRPWRPASSAARAPMPSWAPVAPVTAASGRAVVRMPSARAQSPVARARQARMPWRQARGADRSRSRCVATRSRLADSGEVSRSRSSRNTTLSRRSNGIAVGSTSRARSIASCRITMAGPTSPAWNRPAATRARPAHGGSTPSSLEPSVRSTSTYSRAARRPASVSPRLQAFMAASHSSALSVAGAATRARRMVDHCAVRALSGSASDRWSVLSHSTHKAHSASICSPANRSSSASVPA